MTRKVTIKDIAKEAGVSVSLVSFVMNNRLQDNGKRKYRVSAEAKEKILRIAKEMGYHPNPAARTLRSGHSHVIGAVLPDIANPFYGEIARQLETIAFKKGYTVLIGSTDEDPKKLRRVVDSFIDKRVDGFLVVPCDGSEECIAGIVEAEFPCVIADRTCENVSAPTIMLENEGAIEKSLQILCKDVAPEKIEMISYTMRVDSIVKREEGFKRGMSQRGVPEEDIRINRVDHDTIPEDMGTFVPEILKRGSTGIVFATNALTIEAMKVMTKMGVKVQEDIHIVGFDNSDVYEVFRPPIPHIQQPTAEICNLCLEKLFSFIEGKAEQKKEVITLQSKAVVP